MVTCIFGEELSLPLRSDEIDRIEVAEHLPQQVLAPVNIGDILGEADILVNGQLLTKIPLKAASEAIRHDFKTSLEKVLNCVVSFSTYADIELVLPEF